MGARCGRDQVHAAVGNEVGADLLGLGDLKPDCRALWCCSVSGERASSTDHPLGRVKPDGGLERLGEFEGGGAGLKGDKDVSFDIRRVENKEGKGKKRRRRSHTEERPEELLTPATYIYCCVELAAVRGVVREYALV